MKIICITGTPGSGKTEYAKKLAKKLGYKYLDVNKLIDKSLILKYDKKLDTKVINLDKLKKVLIKIIKDSKENLIIDSHLSHHLDKKYVDEVIVVKTDLKNIKKRLEKRNYNKDKIKENLEAEALDVCYIEALEFGHKVKVVKN